MQSAYEGFVIECESKSDFHLFHYHHLVKEGASWHSRQLFSFQVPPLFFVGPNRIYESILPLVPRCVGSFIYFSSYNEDSRRMVLYRFNKQTNTSECIAKAPGHLFVPVFSANQGWSGGTSYPFKEIFYS